MTQIHIIFAFEASRKKLRRRQLRLEHQVHEATYAANNGLPYMTTEQLEQAAMEDAFVRWHPSGKLEQLFIGWNGDIRAWNGSTSHQLTLSRVGYWCKRAELVSGIEMMQFTQKRRL